MCIIGPIAKEILSIQVSSIGVVAANFREVLLLLFEICCFKLKTFAFLKHIG